MSDTLFDGAYSGRKVLVFGHTGFKGSWLSLWLKQLGAEVVGASIDFPTQPNHFEVAGLEQHVDSHFLDIRNAAAVENFLCEVNPDFMFHLAAQSLVRTSYSDPLLTYTTNTLGTANILNALRKLSGPCTAVLITSDKCYDNVETYYGYRETDSLGGKDPYSASKAAAEIIIKSYRYSFFQDSDAVSRFAVGRAGNVIGGGDWAADRLVPDLVRAWDGGGSVSIRYPQSTRPWQHVLEPLSGYLRLGSLLHENYDFHGEAFNFGPATEDILPVSSVTDKMQDLLSGLKVENLGRPEDSPHEAGLLSLCCDKSLALLGWRPVMRFEESLEMTADWYRQYYRDDTASMFDTSVSQIRRYTSLGADREHVWAK